ncbi:hypothetical protein MBENS4_3715 [Novosphingobium sp. MBES04]|nr:hypothetical protein MBENS4_3715 [Novosphingobium sp. MBES04]
MHGRDTDPVRIPLNHFTNRQRTEVPVRDRGRTLEPLRSKSGMYRIEIIEGADIDVENSAVVPGLRSVAIKRWQRAIKRQEAHGSPLRIRVPDEHFMARDGGI